MVSAIVLSFAIVMIGAEWWAPGRRWPQVRGWWLRAGLVNLVQAGIVWLAGWAWDGWLLRHRPWSADALGIPASAALGYLTITFLYYWWHRWRHESGLLWRWFHQLHHSPQRIEILTSFYKHPFELLANGLLSSAILYWVAGASPPAATYAVLLTGVAELFYHWNVRTPHWLGYWIQRPESHCVHHQEGLHAYNYADLPLWDMLFGTFHNPREWNERCGFGPRGEARIAAMLCGRDVSRPQVPEASR
jgi:sterol desaturase/sphingolipid hydroxylase (fatty acid hydroxylase superfamily)